MHASLPARARERGFTLVEAMVALVVLAVGMLGIAGLYVSTLRSGGSAISRLQAVNFAADMADRIRANRLANVAYAGAAANNNCYGAGAAVCTPQQLAANDLLVWQAQVTRVLPGGAATVTGVALVPGTANLFTYVITVSWTETDGTNPSCVLNIQA